MLSEDTTYTVVVTYRRLPEAEAVVIKHRVSDDDLPDTLRALTDTMFIVISVTVTLEPCN